MNILVTGGAGFIGSHLSKALLKQGHEITVIDNLHSYYSKERKLRHLEEIRLVGNFQFHSVDLLDSEICKPIFSNQSFDCVIHLAALPGVAYSLEQPLAYVDYDIKATINVLKLAGEHQIKKLLFASSSSVYGERKIKGPIEEQMANGRVASPYAAAKYSAESFCHAYQSIYGFDLTILRFFTVYGPWVRPDMAIPTFITKLMNNQPIDVYGQKTARDYTYIDDIIEGILLAIKSPKTSEIYNLGYGKPIDMEELLELFHVYFPEMKVNRLPFRTGDVNLTWSDITKAQVDLGYQPKVDIKEGLVRTIEWAKQYAKE